MFRDWICAQICGLYFQNMEAYRKKKEQSEEIIINTYIFRMNLVKFEEFLFRRTFWKDRQETFLKIQGLRQVASPGTICLGGALHHHKLFASSKQIGIDVDTFS